MSTGTIIKDIKISANRSDASSTSNPTLTTGTNVSILETVGSYTKISYDWSASITPYLEIIRDNTQLLIFKNGTSYVSTGRTINSGCKFSSFNNSYTSQGDYWRIIYGESPYFIDRAAGIEVTSKTYNYAWIPSSSVKVKTAEEPTPESYRTDAYVTNSGGTPLFSSNDTRRTVIDFLPVNTTLSNVTTTKLDTADGVTSMVYVSYKKNGTTVSGWTLAKNIGYKKLNTISAIAKNDAVPVTTSNDGSSTVQDDSVEWTSRGYTSTNPDWTKLAAQYESDQIQYDIYANAYNTVYDDVYYQKLSRRNFNTLGYPPKYNMDVDIQYTDQDSTSGVDIAPGVGRVFGKTILSNPPILSICPGKVKMFPNLMGVERDNFLSMMVSWAAGNDSLRSKIEADESGAFSGKLYQFEADTKSYGYYVNALCRACAILLNLGDQVVPNLGTKKLKDFDYSYWSLRSDYRDTGNGDTDTSMYKNFFEAAVAGAKRIVTSLVEDTTYINFFLNGSETSVSESISADVENSPLDSIFGSINSMSSMINYFTGSGFNVGSDQSSIMESLSSALGIGTTGLSGILDVGKNILKGGKVVLPKMLSGATYGKTISCSTKFISPYGAPLSVFLKCIIPICHLLALALPKQVSDNMYTYPFLVSANQRGQFNVDLGVITNLNITRGGMDNTSWTIESLPTEWEVTFDIVPLVDELMISGTNHPVLFSKNENLISYLGNMCGFDLIANNFDTKIEVTKAFITNKFTGYPRAINNALADKLFNTVRKYTTVAWS